MSEKFKYLDMVEFDLSRATNFPFKGVYLIDDYTESLYVGQTINLFERINQHVCQAINRTHYNKELAGEIWATWCFDCKIRVTFLTGDIYQEQYFIEQLKPKFNIAKGLTAV